MSVGYVEKEGESGRGIANGRARIRRPAKGRSGWEQSDGGLVFLTLMPRGSDKGRKCRGSDMKCSAGHSAEGPHTHAVGQYEL